MGMMVAYSFQSRFVPLIREGLKTQTVRSARKRHARPGEPIQLFRGMRTRLCEKIVPDPVCTAILPIAINFASARINRIEVGRVPLLDLDAFAVADGFEHLDDMSAFWREHHGSRHFDGVVIEWTMPRCDGRS
ncbi:hypothetical protein OEZ60_20510 [Defluviimonas sp. WL0024]|uniref:ASCH domain-containing protein n=1 Tax=Albidovulum salinarum TaxID=2984153 RepID=A0ABT2X8U0_9RHOB|nr:hypothetical protein [Defluviimonas sp. WL0024]MCU9850371.1 hypothetical protein [Defluviimonas sp. WL0024]